MALLLVYLCTCTCVVHTNKQSPINFGCIKMLIISIVSIVRGQTSVATKIARSIGGVGM